MPTEQHYKFVNSALKVLLFLFFSAIVSFSHAASFGRLTVLSSLGQPLRAEVELLFILPDEVPSLAVSLASGEAYKRSGIDYTSLLQSLTVSIENEGDRHFINIRSAEPVNEPYIGVLLTLSAGQERKEQEYVIVLDPAEWTNLRSAPLSSTASTQRLSRQQHAGRQSTRAFSVTVARPAAVIREKETAASTEYIVSRGDTLSKIAGRLGSRNVSLEQMLVALYRNNPDAFLNNNMNLLREGAVLSIPEPGDAGDVSQRNARRIVRLHAANFRRYSQRLAGMVQKSAPATTVKTGPVAEGKVSASVKEQSTPASKLPDRLELSKARPDAASAGITAEEKIAMTRAIEDANHRIAELEKNVNELRGLLEIISKNGNALTKPAGIAATQTETEVFVRQPEAVKPQETQPKAEETGKAEADTPQTATGIIEKTPSSDTKAASDNKGEGVSPDQTLAESGKKAEAPEKKDDEDNEDDDDQAEAGKKQGFLYNLKNSMAWRIAIGVTAALIFLIVLVVRMRRKKPGASAPKPVPAATLPEEEKKEDANPNIISGRDFLESLTGREVMDDEDEDDDETAYRPMIDDEDDDNDAAARYQDDEVLEETASKPEEAEVAEEVIAEPEEEEVPEEVEEVEEVISKSEEVDAEMIAEPEEEEVLEEDVSGFEAADTGEDEGDMALELDDSDEPVAEAIEEEDDAEEPPPLELDLSDINLEPAALDAEDDLPDMARSAKPEEPEPNNAEMAAKLELALAYVDMKDREGARELLEEVIERGTPKQVIEARQALQYL